MDNNVINMGKEKVFAEQQEMAQRIRDVLADYAGTVSVAQAVGILEILKFEILS